MNYHLTDIQLDDQLLGDLSADASAHLASCQICQQRVTAAEEPFASFREVGLAWAERRSATMPLPPAARPFGTTRRLAWATAAVAAMAIGVAIPVVRHSAITSATVSQPATTETAFAEQVALDNQMLDDIDRELNASASSPASYGLQATATTPTPTQVSTVQN